MEHDQMAETVALQEEGLALLRRRPGSAGSATPRARAELGLNLVYHGRILASFGRPEQGMEMIEQGIAILRVIPHPVAVGIALHLRGRLDLGWRHFGRGTKTLVEAVEILEPLSKRRYRQVQLMLGMALLMQGDFQQCESILRETVSQYSQIQASGKAAGGALLHLGDVLIAQGKFDLARERYAEGEVNLARLGMAWQVAIPLVQGLGDIARLQGNLDEAEQLLTEGLATARRVGFQQRIATSLDNLSRLRYDQGRYAEAKVLLDEALTIARRIDFRFAIVRVLCQMGHTEAALDEDGQAVAHYTEALQIALDEEIALDGLIGVAALKARREQAAEAAELAALVRVHPFADFEAKRRAVALLAEIEAHLPAAAATPIGSNDFRDVGARLLREGFGL
jgi:tetratricopeptide (TPR) repeat protein